MKTLKFEEENEEAWLAARIGRITGSKVKDVMPKKTGTGKKIGFYELVAEKLGVPADGESPMMRGHRLEKEAIAMFTKDTGKEVDTSLVMWLLDDEENIAVSPDGFIGDEEAVEVKCLGSARHIEAWHTNEIPSDYEYQVIQYFVVNPKLLELHFIFYDPRLLAKPYFYFTVKRGSLGSQIQASYDMQRKELAEINNIVLQLSF